MKTTSVLLALAASALAVPTDYAAPPGGWANVKYPPGTGANLPYYPPPPGGWESVVYPKGTGSLPAALAGQKYTSYFSVVATPDQVIATNQSPAPGQGGALGVYNFGLNKDTDTICYVRLVA